MTVPTNRPPQSPVVTEFPESSRLPSRRSGAKANSPFGSNGSYLLDPLPSVSTGKPVVPGSPVAPNPRDGMG